MVGTRSGLIELVACGTKTLHEKEKLMDVWKIAWAEFLKLGISSNVQPRAQATVTYIYNFFKRPSIKMSYSRGWKISMWSS